MPLRRTPVPAGPDAAPARPGTVLVVVSAAVFLASLDLFIVNIAFPDIRAAFRGNDLGSLSWVLNGDTVVFAAFLALAGRLADRYGRRRLFLLGVAMFTLASAACAGTVSVPMLVAFRALQAVGAALVMPTSLALLLTAFPAERRTVAVGAGLALMPGQLLTGTGVGLIMPSTSAIVGTALPAARWGVGSSMINTFRQIGSVLGIAIPVVIHGPVQDLAAFRHGWLFMALTAAGVLAAGVGIHLGTRAPQAEPVPAPG